ncbi:disease resistance protein RPV1 [Medicago truncatula]|uniref:disease resistance protein RPV1 n=1 Tax=Medicago truncatula TaxID=3880 RepID=UPI000D2F392B|nr:disease resistance protein RPV1 [Medicago truncatula]
MINVAAASSSSSLMPSPKKYDVFLSFRGEDTRDNITSHLCEALNQKKVETYIDYRLEKGEGIGPSLITAIEESHVSVVIFSENYASSKWCLDEIVKIMECKKDRGQIVIPVFYKIDPSHVRNQRGTYKKWFAKHESDLMSNSSQNRVFNWRSAVTEAANLAGWDFQTYRSESQFIKDIVKDILQRLNFVQPIELKGVVGIEENYEGVKSLLEMGSKEVKRIGIWGMGGIGKTTLAIALHAKLFSQFEGHCFLANVREQTEKNSIDFLRNKLFSELLEEENLHVDVPKVEYRHVNNRLRRKKVLIVLDNVANSEQLDDLISDSDYECLGPGSRVIVTTRDKHITSNVDEIYEVKELNKHNSLQLFCLTVFKEKHPKSGYEELSESVIAYCKGNPLALKVLGARLRSRSKEAWKNELEKLQKIPEMKIQNVLKLSYDDLDSDEQNIFLDIACFVKGESKDRVTSFLKACNFFPGIRIDDLVEKSLVTISNKGTIQMHDLIQEMGWNIVHQESPKDPGSRSRLWDPKEVYDGTESVEGITLDVSKIEDLHLSSNSFSKMSEMRFLKFYYGKYNGTSNIYLPEGLDSLSDKLRYLEWHRYCLKSLPLKFDANLLVELCMPYSNLQKLWDGVQNLVNLKEIDLRFCKELVEVPDLSMAKNLEGLSLSQCKNLREIHPSILSLDKLQDLELEGCKKITSLQTDNHLESLQSITLSNCSSLREFSVTSNNLKNLWLDGTSIEELPSSIWCCQKLKMIDLHNCDNLLGFGDNIENYIEIGSLNTLVLSGCKQLNASNLYFNIKAWQSTLTSLNLENCCNLKALPDNIGLLSSLQRLRLSGSNVESLTPNIKNLNNLKELRLDYCKKLVSVSVSDFPPSLRLFSAINCISLVTDLTTLDIPFEHRSKPQPYPQSVFFPGTHVPKRFSFCSEENHPQCSTSEVTVGHLPESGLYGFVLCLVLSKSNDKYGAIQCNIYQNSKYIGGKATSLGNLHLVRDHVFLWYLDIRGGATHISLHGQIQKRGGWDNPYNMSFQFSLENEEGEWSTERIKGCGVLPLYHLEESNNYDEMNELQVTEIGSYHVNEEDQTKKLHQVTVATCIKDEKLDSNKTSSSHIFVVPTATNINGCTRKPQCLEEEECYASSVKKLNACYTNTSSAPTNQVSHSSA